ncbi:hypothetical protein ACQKWADRAFT_325029 [Trichoderma austrokoningii]
MSSTHKGPKRPRRQTIDFGCEIPFTTVPKLIADGFSELDKLFQKGNKSVLNHYHAAHMCLVDSLGDYRCDLMLMLALTMAGSSATPQVKEDERCFSASENRKNPALFAANLVTRMLWFLKPSAFPQGTEDERGNANLPIEHKGVNGRILRELGWIEVRGNRNTPRISESSLQDDETLYKMNSRLLRARNDAQEFIGLVFKSTDPVWVDRCSLIIKER